MAAKLAAAAERRRAVRDTFLKSSPFMLMLYFQAPNLFHHNSDLDSVVVLLCICLAF